MLPIQYRHLLITVWLDEYTLGVDIVHWESVVAWDFSWYFEIESQNFGWNNLVLTIFKFAGIIKNNWKQEIFNQIT